MNLLMISGDRSLASGRRGAFYGTLEGLHKHFERIDIICPNVPVHRYDMVVFGNVHVHPSPLPLVFQWFWIWHKGRQLIKAHGHTLMTVHEYAPVFNGVGARAVRWSTGIPYVLEVMHVTGLPRASGLWEWFNRWLLKTFISWEARSARAVRVINRHQTPDFLVAAGVPREKIVHIPAFYIDLETFHPADVPKQYDIAFVGRLSRNKGLNIFLDVTERLGLVGVCVGDGPLLAWARRQAKQRKLKLHFPGHAQDASEVARHLNESKLLLMPSLNEGGPRVVLEAMACGVPVIATPVGIVPDILPPECIEEWDSADLADKVTNILGDQALYARLREHGIAMAQRFEKTSAIAALAVSLQNIAK